MSDGILNAVLHRVGAPTPATPVIQAALQTTRMNLKAADTRLSATALVEAWRNAPVTDRPRLWITAGISAGSLDPLGPAVSEALGIPYVLLEPDPPPAPTPAFSRTLSAASLTVCIGSPAARTIRAALSADQKILALPPFLDAGPLVAMAHLRPQHRAAVASHLRLSPTGTWLLTDLPMTPGEALDGYRMLGLALSRMVLPDWTLLVAGDGPAGAQVEAALRNVGATRIRTWPRPTPEDRMALFAASDLYLWPSGSGVGVDSLLRAQGLGMPVVACRSEATLDRVQQGVTGRLTEPGNGADFGNALSFLLRHPDFRASFGKQGRDNVLARHDIHTIGAELYRALQTLAAQSPGSEH